MGSYLQCSPVSVSVEESTPVSISGAWCCVTPGCHHHSSWRTAGLSNTRDGRNLSLETAPAPPPKLWSDRIHSKTWGTTGLDYYPDNWGQTDTRHQNVDTLQTLVPGGPWLVPRSSHHSLQHLAVRKFTEPTLRGGPRSQVANT